MSTPYRREGEGFLLWSIGRDLKDDGGRPVVYSGGNADGDLPWRAAG